MLLSIVYGRLSYGQQGNFSQSLYDTPIYPSHWGHLSRQGIVKNPILFSFHINKNTPAFHGLLFVHSGAFAYFL